ncbi:plastocyanin/azurin family copper-binding protein [Parapedobacter koreensis]|uniref:Copper binding protein, plastocyanin/azurin family n=1 Tax=Parapedobacter koreensis TaxID=332977 RepID=A0A1H7QPA8_9SPHI|nr:plastocyanin/azurin family copper-binding protein [Parapedobacter koreensis]SEL49127.1 Copper binding protein, plastocyanin/azurin family [Parapedobacter koreensis]
MTKKIIFRLFLVAGCFLGGPWGGLKEVLAQHEHHQAEATGMSPLTERDFYRIETVKMPETIIPEVGGLAQLDDGSMAFVTRRGELWLVHNPNGESPYFSLFASGLHEPLGLLYKDGAFFVAQRAELTRITDVDGDGRADRFETLSNWPLSGNYCEYNHGPVLANDGNFYVNMNLGDNGMGGNAEPFYGEMGSHAKWRGWVMQVAPDGTMKPFAAGLRSPAGLGTNAQGELFYTENQGGWVGTGYIAHVEEGDFFGHPSSLKSAGEPESNIHLTIDDIPRDNPLFHQAVKQIKGMKMPSVRIPHGIMGISTAGFVADKQGFLGDFFKDQLFVGDEGHANIVRVSLEQVNGAYQGVVFPFRKDFASGILRMEWGTDGSLFVGMSDRGWSSTGTERYGLQRLVWTGKVPFEMQSVSARSDGFEIQFTLPVDSASATDPANYQLSSFDYYYHQTYGSDVADLKESRIAGILLSADRKTVRLVLDEMREGYLYEINCDGIRQQGSGAPLLHAFGFYSLNAVPAGQVIAKDTPRLIWIPEPKVEAETPVPAISAKPATKQAVQADAAAEPRKLAKRTTQMPEWWSKGPDKTITIGTLPGLQFSVKEFDVKPGSKVKLVFNNNDDMQHNLLIVQGGATEEVGQLALKLGLTGSKLQYVPKSDKVLFHTNLLQPRSNETIYFEAPSKPGKYEYVCTYPGHFQIMKGVINVKN